MFTVQNAAIVDIQAVMIHNVASFRPLLVTCVVTGTA